MVPVCPVLIYGCLDVSLFNAPLLRCLNVPMIMEHFGVGGCPEGLTILLISQPTNQPTTQPTNQPTNHRPVTNRREFTLSIRRRASDKDCYLADPYKNGESLPYRYGVEPLVRIATSSTTRTKSARVYPIDKVSSLWYRLLLNRPVKNRREFTLWIRRRASDKDCYLTNQPEQNRRELTLSIRCPIRIAT